MLASEVRKGSAELLILGTLATATRHGYDIARTIEAGSGGAVTFNTATLYPTLRRLEQRGLIAGRWVEKAGERRRRFYRITPAGKVVLQEQRQSWRAFFNILSNVAGLQEG